MNPPVSQEQLASLLGETSISRGVAWFELVRVVATTLDEVTPVEWAAVVGGGPLADLFERDLAQRGVTLAPPCRDAQLDLLVDVSGDPAVWGGRLSSLRHEGTLLLLVPFRSEARGFDFYPFVHCRSLRVIARRWRQSPVNPTRGIPTRKSGPASAAEANCLADVLERNALPGNPPLEV